MVPCCFTEVALTDMAKGLIWHCEQMNLAKLRFQDVHIYIIGKAIIPVANIINGCFLLFVIFVLGGMESSFYR